MSATPDLLVPPDTTDHTLGLTTAPVTLVEYGDYECPACLNAQPLIHQLRDKFSDQLRIIFRHYPQNSVHPHASAAALAAEAAGAQHKFWEMHDLLFANQHNLHELDLTHLALNLGLDPYRFNRDSEAGLLTRKVRADYESATASGVTGTPTFFINGCRYQGPCSMDAISDAIRTRLEAEHRSV